MRKKFIQISSNYIHKNASDFQIFEHYVCKYFPNKKIYFNKLVISPFKTSKQVPTFYICVDDSSKKLIFRDTSLNFDGDAIKLVMKLFNIEYPTALRKIYKDLKIKTLR